MNKDNKCTDLHESLYMHQQSQNRTWNQILWMRVSEKHYNFLDILVWTKMTTHQHRAMIVTKIQT